MRCWGRLVTARPSLQRCAKAARSREPHLNRCHQRFFGGCRLLIGAGSLPGGKAYVLDLGAVTRGDAGVPPPLTVPPAALNVAPAGGAISDPVRPARAALGE